ncbi:hypothetical protein M9Y10_031735 [Tritrichomonas musculus]|uniref:Protein kinase domain-containing protein n=1 Tax=Tritrichomonas musculus TaxID=1915356 RepID=A0ABR2H0C2_9EUKA
MKLKSEKANICYASFNNDKTISDIPHSDRLKSYSTFQNHLKEDCEKLKKIISEIPNDQTSTKKPNFGIRQQIDYFSIFISDKNIKDKSKKSSILLGKIHELLTKIDILEINLPPKINFDNIAIVQNLIEKLITFQIANDTKEDIDYDEIISDITHLNLVLNQIIDLLRSVRNIESIVSSVFQRIFNFIQIIQNDKRYEKMKSKINSSSFEDLLIDKYYNLIFTFKLNPKDEPKRTDDINQTGHITKIFTKLINEDLLPIFNDIKLKNENEETTVDEILKNEILSIPTELSEISQIVQKKGTIKESLSLLETFCMRFDTPSKENLSIRNIYLNLLFHIPQKIPFNLLFHSFEPHIGNVKEIYFYKDVLISFKDEYSIPKITKIPEKFERLIEMIQINGKFYEIDFILRMFLEHALNTQLLISKYLKKCDFERTIGFPVIKTIQSVNNGIELFDLLADDELNFVLNKKKFENNEEHSKKKIDRDLRIRGGCISKHIAYMKNDMNPSYFPNGTLDFINSKEGRIELTNVDKIVMIIELATALEDLRSHGEYHGNLSNKFILINSSKDAYIGSTYYDIIDEINASKSKSPLYYRAPEFFQNKRDNDDVKQMQAYDIYAFGVLMFEIITRISPEMQFGNAPREERINIIKANCENEIKDDGKEKTHKKTKQYKDYFEFLSSKGNNLEGMEGIIEKCMKKSSEERYSSFKDLIEDIHKLPNYTNNKEEIEFRLSHAINADQYHCTITDLVENYYRGQIASKYDIENFLSAYLNDDKTVQINDSVIITIFEMFDIKNDENPSQYFGDIFDLIINLSYNREVNKNQSVFDEEDYLLKMSRKANLSKKKKEKSSFQFVHLEVLLKTMEIELKKMIHLLFCISLQQNFH